MREVLGEHGHLAARSPSAACAAKPTEVGEAARQANHDKTIVNKGRLYVAGYPRRGEGCGEPLNDLSDNRIFFKEGSNFGQETPPV